MRVSTSKIVLAVLVVGLWSSAASADVSKADNEIKTVEKLANDLDNLCCQPDPDGAAIERVGAAS